MQPRANARPPPVLPTQRAASASSTAGRRTTPPRRGELPAAQVAAAGRATPTHGRPTTKPNNSKSSSQRRCGDGSKPAPVSHVRGLLTKTAQSLGSNVRYRERRWGEAAAAFSDEVRKAADAETELLFPLGLKLGHSESLIRHAVLEKQHPKGLGFQRRLCLLTSERFLYATENASETRGSLHLRDIASIKKWQRIGFAITMNHHEHNGSASGTRREPYRFRTEGGEEEARAWVRQLREVHRHLDDRDHHAETEMDMLRRQRQQTPAGGVGGGGGGGGEQFT